MNKILIIRHAKSSNPINISDFDRPLHTDGIKDLKKISSDLKALGVKPDIMIHSPALRAKNSALIIAESLGYNGEMRTESDIYYGDSTDLLYILKSVPKTCQTALLVGHNPTLEEFCNQICDSKGFTVEMNTSTAICFSFQSEWKSLMNHTARFEWILTT